MTRRVEGEIPTTDSYAATVPASVRRRAGIETSDELRWIVEEEGKLSVEVISRRYGAFSELQPVDLGEETDATTDHDLVGNGR